jgi:ParB/RepB/Spo0J family partition protein
MGTLALAMTKPAEVALEVSQDELGERLSDVRLVPSTDPAMQSSLRRYGQLSPLVVFRDERQRLEVIDGFRRLRAAAQQGHPALLQVRVLDVDEVRALSALFALHRRGTGLTEIEEAWVVQALVREHGMRQSSVAQLLRRHQSWVSRRLLLVEALSPEVQMDVRLGLCSPTAAREVARLPRGIQQVVARIIARQAMSTRAAAKLVAATERLQPATAEEIERLCQSAQAQTPSRGGPRSDAEAYAADLSMLERVSCRLRGRLVERPPAQLPSPRDQEVRGFLRAAIPVVQVLLETMTKTLEGP